jgi:LPXTG-motif cell wall-anchored protein
VLGEKITKPAAPAAVQVLGAELPRTGQDIASFLFLAGVCLTLGGLVLTFGQRQKVSET